MKHLRDPSARVGLLVDPAVFGIGRNGEQIGRPGPLGRERIVAALPLDPGPVQIDPPLIMQDSSGFYLIDPEGYLVGQPALRVQRMLVARATLDTRRLG